MKKADEIISHILKPFENRLNKHRCLRKIISLIPQNYKKYISKMAYKGDVLYIEVTHPAIRQEIFYKRKMIFEIINLMQKSGICKEINPKKIVTFHKYKPIPKPPKEIKFFSKKAGDFEIKAKNPEIYKKFEEIKKLLKGENC